MYSGRATEDDVLRRSKFRVAELVMPVREALFQIRDVSFNVLGPDLEAVQVLRFELSRFHDERVPNRQQRVQANRVVAQVFGGRRLEQKSALFELAELPHREIPLEQPFGEGFTLGVPFNFANQFLHPSPFFAGYFRVSECCLCRSHG